MKKLLSWLLVAVLMLSVCPALAEDTGYTESPILTPLVESGELPPVEERLPKNPGVLEVEEIGTYGGTWHQATPQGTFNHAVSHMMRYLRNGLIYTKDKQNIVPTWLESFEYNDEYTEFTFTIREGLRWSDGEFVTTEDVAFWFNDIVHNTEYTPTDSYYYDCTLEIVDDYTWKFIFETPKTMYLTYWAKANNSVFVLPAHYLKQYHPAYATEEELAATLEAEGYDNWVTMIGAKGANGDSVNTNKDLPTTCAWIMTVDPATDTTVTYERNPYYWCVDQNGQQLPYIDHCIINIVESTDLMNMKVVAGEIDYQAAGLSESFSNYPLFAQYAEEMNYKVWTTEHNEPGALNFFFNIASTDPVKGPILQNVDFRKALSLGMDRDAVISTFYSVGPFVAKKVQFSFLEASPYYDDEWTNLYIDMDLEQANAILDAMGMDQYDADGWRMSPDGQVVDFTCLSPNYDSQWAEVAEMVCSQWRENLKVNVNVKEMDPSLWGSTLNTGDFDLTDATGSGENGFLTLTMSAVNDWTAYTSPSWGCFCFDGAYYDEDAEMPAEVARLAELGKLIVTTADKDEQEAAIKEVVQIWKDGLFNLAICRRLPAIIVIKNYVHNVKEEDHGASWDYGANGVVRADGIWFDADAQ